MGIPLSTKAVHRHRKVLIRVETHTQPDVCLVIQQQPLSR